MQDLLYLVAACLFILGLKQLGSPRTAPRGNAIAALGMLVAAVATIATQDSKNGLLVIAIGIAIGSVVGIVAATRVQMTAMPQMVALLNGLGGAASALVAGSELTLRGIDGPVVGDPAFLVAVSMTGLIGAVTLTGSAVAFAKLQELISGRPLVYPLQKTVNLVLLVACVAFSVWTCDSGGDGLPFMLLCVTAAVLGVLSVLPIGGADMPVVISLLNSYSGLAAASAGFVLGNNALIVGGSLVGASGIILTQIMCKAMNRSLPNVLFGTFGQTARDAGAPSRDLQGTVKSGSPEEAAMILDSAEAVVVVPGYGMAVAQAQHAVRELADLLQKNGTETKYAIHPVAGRMPGHMNVLLAEANVPYDEVFELEDINSEFSQTDVAFIIGANDVVNPAAKTDKSSPIYGMPVFDVDKAKTVFFIKRSMGGVGYAGVDNDVFYMDQTMMLLADAKKMVEDIVKNLGH